MIDNRLPFSHLTISIAAVMAVTVNSDGKRYGT